MKTHLHRVCCGIFLAVWIAAGSICVFAYASPSKTIRWTGGYPLVVKIKSKAGKPIRSVRCETFVHQECVENAIDFRSADNAHRWLSAAVDFEGGPLTVTVQTGGRESVYGFVSHTYIVTPFVAVLVEYNDGQTHAQWLRVPDRTITEEVEFLAP